MTMTRNEEELEEHTTSCYVVDCLKDFVRVYNDGTVVRKSEPVFPPLKDVENSSSIMHRDVTIDGSKNLWVRLYVPKEARDKLPVIVYYHWGGFIFFNADNQVFHKYCTLVSSSLHVMVVSVNYRLAPEHRLPAAYEDSLQAIKWVSSCGLSQGKNPIPDPWLEKHADLEKVVLMGESAGANIAYQTLMAMLDMAEKGADSLVKVRGAVLVQPNFSGEVRTKSEEQGSVKNGKGGYSIEVSDTLWRLALPLGANRDHPFVNPLSSSCSWDMSLLKSVAVLVVIAGDDIHGERVQEWAEKMEGCCERLTVVVCEGEDHGFAVLKMGGDGSNRVVEEVGVFLESITNCDNGHPIKNQEKELLFV